MIDSQESMPIAELNRLAEVCRALMLGYPIFNGLRGVGGEV